MAQDASRSEVGSILALVAAYGHMDLVGGRKTRTIFVFSHDFGSIFLIEVAEAKVWCNCFSI